MRIKLLLPILLLNLFAFASTWGQGYIRVPKIHSNISSNADGELMLYVEGRSYVLQESQSSMTLENIIGNPQTASTGIYFDFKGAVKAGSLYYGLIPYDDTEYPLPVYFRAPARILDGKAFVNLMTLRYRYDMVGWEKKGKGVIGYRIVDLEGNFLYEGRIGFKGKDSFQIDTTLIEGPFVNLLGPSEATISFKSNIKIQAKVLADNREFLGPKNATNHEILLSDLKPDTKYEYTVVFGTNEESYSFTTAPIPGSRKKFVFGYASDSRSGPGGGERNIYGANAYIMKKIMALAKFRNSAFVQFTGDLVTGYKTDPNDLNVEYANWKRAVEPFWHHMPVMTTMGNHEALMYYWSLPGGDYYSIDKFPFEENSTEKIYADNFVNPTNGPESEDGAVYDPDRKRIDFPSYSETVYHYAYDNVGVIVLNSNYWYAPSTSHVDVTSGNIHAYIMDNQVQWLQETLDMFEKDNNIDHVFITEHTPFFPNGGHVGDDMWYLGNNEMRPYVNGKPVEKGIIERRDEMLEIIVNRSTKAVAILTGDEHNYCKTQITPETNLYPDNWQLPKLKLSRSIYQINNGAAGAPYYAQEKTPWTPFVSGFTTQNALVLFHVEGKSIFMEVLNPDTLDKVDELQLR